MNRRPYVLAVCAVALAAFVAWDYWPKRAPPAAGQTREAPAPPIAVLNPLSQRPMGDFQALFDHPLFDPTRSPPAQEVVIQDSSAAPQTTAIVEQPVLPPRPVLMGTLTSPSPGGAYLGDDAGGGIVFLRPGQSAQGLTLRQVFAESAVFQGPDGPVTLPLQDAIAPEAVGVPEIAPTMTTTLPSP